MPHPAHALRNRLTSYLVIPARLHSTRLPQKLLLKDTGKSLLQHTYESASHALKPTGLCVAADHSDIADEVRRFGGQVVMTNPLAANGTDRVAEVARELENVDIVVNVQGDEPELGGQSIDHVIELLERNPDVAMATLATPIRTRARLMDPSCVKVVFNGHGRALYFSRSPIPCARDWEDVLLNANPPLFYQHIGMYAYRREFLLGLADLPPSEMEKVEQLEQLRVLDAGHTILVGVIGQAAPGIDTLEDYRAFVRRRVAC